MTKLINISEATSIAIHSLALIANSKETVNVNHLSDVLGFSKNHMAKVLQVLVRFNYLDSNRGPHGGFRLKVDPEKINLLSILELLEGELELDHCNHKKEDCPFESCVYGDIRTNLMLQFREYFGNKTLKEITLKNKYKFRLQIYSLFELVYHHAE